VKPRSFNRTRAALAAYDAVGEAMDTATDDNASAVVAAWDAALRGVAEAFADDTADVNDRALVLEGFRQHDGADLRAARALAK
jgi:hypothetical protein